MDVKLKENIVNFINTIYKNKNKFNQFEREFNDVNYPDNVYDVILKTIDTLPKIEKLLFIYTYGLYDKTELKYWKCENKYNRDYYWKHWCEVAHTKNLELLCEIAKEHDIKVAKFITQPYTPLNKHDISHIICIKESTMWEPLNVGATNFKTQFNCYKLSNRRDYDLDERIGYYIKDDNCINKIRWTRLNEFINMSMDDLSGHMIGQITIDRIMLYLKCMGFDNCNTIINYQKYLDGIEAKKTINKTKRFFKNNFRCNSDDKEIQLLYDECQLTEVKGMEFNIWPFNKIKVSICKNEDNKYCAAIYSLDIDGKSNIFKHEVFTSLKDSYTSEQFYKIFNQYNLYDNLEELETLVNKYVNTFIQLIYQDVKQYIK